MASTIRDLHAHIFRSVRYTRHFRSRPGPRTLYSQNPNSGVPPRDWSRGRRSGPSWSQPPVWVHGTVGNVIVLYLNRVPTHFTAVTKGSENLFGYPREHYTIVRMIDCIVASDWSLWLAWSLMRTPSAEYARASIRGRLRRHGYSPGAPLSPGA